MTNFPGRESALLYRFGFTRVNYVLVHWEFQLAKKKRISVTYSSGLCHRNHIVWIFGIIYFYLLKWKNRVKCLQSNTFHKGKFINLDKIQHNKRLTWASAIVTVNNFFQIGTSNKRSKEVPDMYSNQFQRISKEILISLKLFIICIYYFLKR